MKQTNYQLFDFLDFDPALSGHDVLWKVCEPVIIQREGNDVTVNLPFQKQKVSNDITPDTEEPRKHFTMRLKAYGENVLRVSISFDGSPVENTSMLEFSADNKEMESLPLSAEKDGNCWIVKDSNLKTRAVFDFTTPPKDHWSDLLPPPEESLNLTLYPDGKKAVQISAYDQFFPARMDAMPLAFVERDEKPHRSTMSFYAKPDECFTGTGERFTKMDLAGKTFQLDNQDAQGVNNRRAYKNIPFYLSSEMYGLFLHTSAVSKFSLADHSTRSAQIMTEEPALDLFLIGDENPERILYRYRQLTGFPALPPLWSYGVWMSRMTYFSADEVNQICKRLRDEDYPCDVIHLDTGWFRQDWLCEWKFNPDRFPDPAKFVSDLKKDGFRVSLWQMPYIAYGAEQYEEAVSQRYIGKVYENRKESGSNFSALDYAGSIDFTKPAAVRWYQNLLKALLKAGVACIKTDFGEEIHQNAEYYGMNPEQLNNLYGLLYQKAAFDITKKITGEGIIWARAGWAGAQRYPVHWGGDAAASWDGMAGSLKGGLHIGLSGFGFWSHDVPGFHGVPDFMNAVISDKLYMRWTQFGVFTSHLRYHGTSKREPYHFPEIAPLVRKWWKLRYALLPYIYEQGEKSANTGFPVLRALLFHHSNDPMCWHIDNQYYFGDHFLVAPVMNAKNKRDVYLPEGHWVNFFTGEYFAGGQWLKDFEVSLKDMPVWVRYGAEIGYYPYSVNCTDEMDLSQTKTLVFDNNYKGVWNSSLGKLIEG